MTKNTIILSVLSELILSKQIRACIHLTRSLPNDKILDWSKLKKLADDKINIT